MSNSRFIGGVACCTLTLMLLGCQGFGADAPPPAEAAPHSDRGGIGLGSLTQEVVSPSQEINARRSLAVTETAILSQFSLTAVVDQLAAQNGAPGFTGTQLFRQLWETQNAAATGPTVDLQPSAHCTDDGTTLNGFPNVCRSGEGAQADAGNFTNINSYSAIGLYNRFDLAPNTGSNCGEYRVVFGKTSGGSGRAFIIFEAVLPNPRSDLGLEGCRQVQAFWRDLSNTADISTRATALRNFYFTGLPGYQPAIHIDNYGFNSSGAGQVRVNMFVDAPWELKELKLLRQCPGGACVLKAVPVTVKVNPFGDLFDPSSAEPLAADFQQHFVTQVQSLALGDVNRFTYQVPDQFNAAHSDAQSFGAEDDYLANFAGPSGFRDDIQAQLDNLGSSLTPDDLVARAQALSCGGCHQRSFGADLGGGMQFATSAGFVHNTEIQEPGPDGTRFFISFGLENTFLPFRKGIVEEFLSAPHPVTPISRFNMAGVAADGKNVYWVENRPSGSVMQASLNSGSERLLAFNRANPISVTTDGVNVYWAEASGSIFRTPVGGGPISTFASGISNLGGVATDGSHVYWTQGGNIIRRKSVNGGGTTTRVSRSGMTGRIAVDGTSIYWQESNDIQKTAKSGGAISTLITRPSITGIASDGTNVYLAEDLFPGNLLRVPVGGGAATVAFNGTFLLTGVAVGATHFAWTLNTNPGAVMAKVKD